MLLRQAEICPGIMDSVTMKFRRGLPKALPEEFLSAAYMLPKFSGCYYDSFLLIIEEWLGILIMRYNCVEKGERNIKDSVKNCHVFISCTIW